MTNLTSLADGRPAASTGDLPVLPGQDPQPSVPDRPYWLTGPCPAWCEHPEDHEPRDCPDDRVHMGSAQGVTLTLVDAEVTASPGGEIEVSIPRLDVYLMQGWRESEPHVEFDVNDEPGISLSLAEVAELAEALAGLIRQAGGTPS